jgi:hypothetical protein
VAATQAEKIVRKFTDKSRWQMKATFLCGAAVAHLALYTFVIAAPPKKSAAHPHHPAAGAETNPSRMSQLISALETLYELRATPEQMMALQKIADDTAQPAREVQPVRIKQDLKHVMQELHDALVSASNSDRIESLQDKYYGMLETQKVEFDDDVDTTQAASDKAAEFIRSLTTSQIVTLISANEDDIRDPRSVLSDAVSEGRSKEVADWNDLRDSAADDAATLMYGSAASDEDVDKFKRWLDEAHKLDDAAFKKRFSNPVQAAAQITGRVDWAHVLQNWVQSSIADLLSNPELGQALKERLK